MELPLDLSVEHDFWWFSIHTLYIHLSKHIPLSYGPFSHYLWDNLGIFNFTKFGL